jgi:hypothetical protein
MTKSSGERTSKRGSSSRGFFFFAARDYEKALPASASLARGGAESFLH